MRESTEVMEPSRSVVDEEEERARSADEFPDALPLDVDDASVGVFEAVRWYWRSVVLLVLVFAGIGAAIGLVRSPDYEATARLNVDFSSQTPSSLPGSLTAAQALTDSYARSIYSAQVGAEIARKEGIGFQELPDRVSATPIPDSTIVQVIANDGTTDGATTLANQASRALIDYVASLDRPNGRLLASLLADFKEAAARYDRILSREQQLEANAGTPPSREEKDALEKAAVQTQAALLKRETASQRYTGAKQNYVAKLQLLEPARGATSDRIPTLELTVFLGAIAGLALGAALATVRANRV